MIRGKVYYCATPGASCKQGARVGFWKAGRKDLSRICVGELCVRGVRVRPTRHAQISLTLRIILRASSPKWHTTYYALRRKNAIRVVSCALSQKCYTRRLTRFVAKMLHHASSHAQGRTIHNIRKPSLYWACVLIYISEFHFFLFLWMIWCRKVYWQREWIAWV